MRPRRTLAAIVVVLAVAAFAFVWLTSPDPLPATAIPAHQTSLRNGETLYRAASCLACHRPPDGGSADRNLPSGGRPFKTPVGVFYPQNITPDLETGIGKWSEIDFLNAMARGLGPDGRHYFPAFPYMAYRAMRLSDLMDLRAFLMSLPAVSSPRREADVPLVPLVRRGVGLWQKLAFRQRPHSPDPSRSASWERGAYLVNAPGHCGECHTPKSWLMIEDLHRHLAGGPHPGGDGKVPSLHGLVVRKRYKDADDLVLALQNGETLGYEHLSSGGMAQIQESLSHLPEADLRAVSEYLLSLD